MSGRDAGWWDDFFPAARPIFGIVSKKFTNDQVKYLIKKMNLKPGSKFLDCPCGIGRISLPLARKGIKVTGVDITTSYLEELEKKAKKRGLKIPLHHLDMRRIDFRNEFDAGGNLWTSFGYFQKESDNLLSLKKMYQALKPGGKFLLHVINRDWIIANYKDNEWYDIGKTRCFEKRYFDFATSINQSQWGFLKDGKEKWFDVPLRMYSYHELIAMFKSVGFVDIEGYGTVKEEPINFSKMMMFVFATKPGRKKKK